MFESLSDRFDGIFTKLRGKGRLQPLHEGPVGQPEMEAGHLRHELQHEIAHRGIEGGTRRSLGIGRDIEAQVLARAVKSVAERRVFLNGERTVVFK